jgi:serine/threonine-protein kinase HipA
MRINVMARIGYVYVYSNYAGTIEENDDGYRFCYDEEYLKGDNPKPVSLTLPLRKEPYISKTMFSFFDGLIPEGWLLALSEENWKVDRRDRMGLLLSVCADPIGSVSVRRVKE